MDTVLATVFREGLTNILRHSAVKRCEIETGRRGDAVWFRLANDGVVRAASARGSHEGGSGIENLTFRVKRLGGHLTVGVADNGWFELRLEVPLNGVGATPTTASAPERAGSPAGAVSSGGSVPRAGSPVPGRTIPGRGTPPGPVTATLIRGRS